jgi:hypothetical protein
VIIWQSTRKRRRSLQDLFQAFSTWWYVDRKY